MKKEPITIEKIDVEDRNVKNIFDEFNEDVDNFLEKYPEIRILSKEEVMDLYAYCETSQKFQFSEEVILGSGRSTCYRCIFKIEDGRWIVWNTDERRGFYNAQVFNNANDACTTLIELQSPNSRKFECRDYFESFLINDSWHPNYPSDEKLEEFAKDFNYELSKTRTLKK